MHCKDNHDYTFWNFEYLSKIYTYICMILNTNLMLGRLIIWQKVDKTSRTYHAKNIIITVHSLKTTFGNNECTLTMLLCPSIHVKLYQQRLR